MDSSNVSVNVQRLFLFLQSGKKAEDWWPIFKVSSNNQIGMKMTSMMMMMMMLNIFWQKSDKWWYLPAAWGAGKRAFGWMLSSPSPSFSSHTSNHHHQSHHNHHYTEVPIENIPKEIGAISIAPNRKSRSEPQVSPTTNSFDHSLFPLWVARWVKSLFNLS